jgi:hypothetical protein
VTTWYSQVPLATVQSVDHIHFTRIMNYFIDNDENIKVDLVRTKEHTIVTVPCWWNGSSERYAFTLSYLYIDPFCSLLASICFQRPDLFNETARPPIQLNPPNSFFKRMCI